MPPTKEGLEAELKDLELSLSTLQSQRKDIESQLKSISLPATF